MLEIFRIEHRDIRFHAGGEQKGVPYRKRVGSAERLSHGEDFA